MIRKSLELTGRLTLLLIFSACQPNAVAVPVTVLVKETQVVPITVPVTVPVTVPPPSTEPAIPQPLPIFATANTLLNDLRIRQGIAYCTDRAPLIRAVYPWIKDPSMLEMNSIVPRLHWAYPQGVPEFMRYPYDPETGKALFEEAGWMLAEGASYRTNAAGEEMALKLTTSDIVFRKTWAAVFEEQMRACGLRLTRFHAPREWFLGDETGLRRRDFELTAFAWAYSTDPGGETAYGCDHIPSAENGWQGDNFMGWCNPKANEAIHVAMSAVSREERRQAYWIVQEELSKDVPSIPLFTRVQVSASNPALENFMPDPSGVYTWNVAEWKLTGKDTIVIGETSEPTELSPMIGRAYVKSVIEALIFGTDYTSLNYDYQPVMLKQLATVESGRAVNNVVEVKEGDPVVDADGNTVELRQGIRTRNAKGEEEVFTGGTTQTKQLVVTYEFADGLTWSDGKPVSKADYRLAYRAGCDPDNPEPGLYLCDKIEGVDFVSDTAYVVTWKPGYQDPLYFLPPFSRVPAHQVLNDGRVLIDVPISEWPDLPEIVRTPLGVGPYVITHWTPGKEMTLAANPFYYKGLPATPNIVIRFIWPIEDAVELLIDGKIDILGWDALGGFDKVDDLVTAQTEEKVRLFVTPSTVYEHIDFALTGR